MIACGATVATVQIGRTPMETLKNIPVNIRGVRPHFLLSVPALAKNFPQKHRIVDPRQRPHDRRAVPAGVEDGIRLQRRRLPPRTRLAMRPAPRRSTVRRHALPQRCAKPSAENCVSSSAGERYSMRNCNVSSTPSGCRCSRATVSEATPVISTNSPRPRKCRFGSSGTLVQPLDCRILDEEGREVPHGQREKIVVRGENVMAGY